MIYFKDETSMRLDSTDSIASQELISTAGCLCCDFSLSRTREPARMGFLQSAESQAMFTLRERPERGDLEKK